MDDSGHVGDDLTNPSPAKAKDSGHEQTDHRRKHRGDAEHDLGGVGRALADELGDPDSCCRGAGPLEGREEPEHGHDRVVRRGLRRPELAREDGDDLDLPLLERAGERERQGLGEVFGASLARHGSRAEEPSLWPKVALDVRVADCVGEH